jgi:hypothetical protein
MKITGRLAQEREYTRLIDTANAPIFVSFMGFYFVFEYMLLLLIILLLSFCKGVDTFGRVNVWNKVSF